MNKPRNTMIPADPILVSRAVQRVTPSTTNPLAVFQAKYQGGSNGVQVDVVTGIAINALSIRLLRGFSLDPAAAKIVQTWNGPFATQDNLEYTDSAAAVLAAQKVYYWVTIIYEQTPTLTQQQFGPQTAFINAVAGGSEQIPAFSYSITPNGAVLDLAISYQIPGASDFGSAQVFLTDYNKIAAPQLISQGNQSPFSFTVDPTGETVTIQVDAVTVSGSLIAGGTTQQAVFHAVATIPAILFNGTAISNTVGNQITFPGPAETNVTALKVYRQNAGGTFAGATLIATLSPSPATSYTVTDQTVTPQDFIYFVTATNSVGESLPSPAITPGQDFSSASKGSGATATGFLAKFAGDTGLVGDSFLAGAPITAGGENYYAQPLVTITGSTLSPDATGTAILDGAGHVQFIQLTSNGKYNSGDTAVISIHY